MHNKGIEPTKVPRNGNAEENSASRKKVGSFSLKCFIIALLELELSPVITVFKGATNVGITEGFHIFIVLR